MITILIIIILFTFIGVLKGDFLEGLICFVCGGFLGVIIACIIGGFLPTYTYETKYETPIYALNDSSTIEGRAYLFSTTVEEEMVYRYIVETEKGLSIQEKEADDCYIVKTTETPKLCCYSPTFEEDWMYLFGIPCDEPYYVFYLPENSITTEYKVDLEN